MNTENGTSGKSSTSANEPNKQNSNSEPTQLTETRLLENTPFAIVRVDNKYFVACGKYRLTSYMDTEDEAEEYARRITWNSITAVIGVIVQAEIEEALKLKPQTTDVITLDEEEGN